MITLSTRQKLIEELQNHKGHNNAIKGKLLASKIGIDDRALQTAIVELTDSGFPICSSCSKPMGYFLPETVQEAEDFKHQMRSRALNDFRRYKKFKQAFQSWFYGQPQRRLL